MINLPDLADRLNQLGIINKSFMSMTKSEILLLVSAVYSLPGDEVPVDGWKEPAIIDGVLDIPFDAHPKYHWWSINGQSIMQTLVDLDAPWEVARKYFDSKYMTEADYMNRLIPF